MFEKLKTTISNGLESPESKQFIPTQIFLASVTILSILSIILETVNSLNGYSQAFLFVEWFAAIVFTIEYLSRIFSTKDKLRYIFSFWGFVDLISILPTFLGLGNLTFLKSIRMLRILRLARIFRMAKISRAYLSTHNEAKTQADMNKMNIAIYFLAITSATVLFGSILYIFEQALPGYNDIPTSMIQVLRILVGGIGYATINDSFGEILVVIIRFVGLALFGLMVSIAGGVMKDWLLGAENKEK